LAIDYTSASITPSQAGRQVPRRQLFCDEVGRREFVCGGGASALSAVLATLLGGSKPVMAEAVTGSLPELDRVAVRIVIDSYQFAVAPSRKLPNLDVQHFGSWHFSDLVRCPSCVRNVQAKRTLVSRSDHAAARSSLSTPRATILSPSSGNGRCNAFASSHGARIHASASFPVIRITGNTGAAPRCCDKTRRGSSSASSAARHCP
jgi:hypothetical protein